MADTTEKLGLKPMDVVKEVNGEAVDSPQKAMELYNTIKTGDTMTIERRPQSSRCVPSIRPNSGGQVEGFKCFSIGELAKAGMHEGDIVTSVDGESLRSPEQAMDLLSRVSAGNFSELRLLRRGREEILKPLAVR